MIEKVAPGVWWLSGIPRGAVNQYLLEDTLVDAGTRWARGNILRACAKRPPRQVVLTHVHPDHQGAAKAVCERFGAPLACHAADALVMEGRVPPRPGTRWLQFGQWLWAGPDYPVSRFLNEGDEVAGFRVVHAPGHTPGHVILFRDADRVAIGGDLLANINFLTFRPGLHQPPTFFSVDRALNRTSIRKLAALEPRLVLFGHGPPLRKMEHLARYCARMRRVYPHEG